MTRKLLAFMFVPMLALSVMAGPVSAVSHTPSDNDANKAKGWAHFNVVETGIGYATIEFVSERAFWSCFEYRSNGEAPQSATNPNTGVGDGLWPYTCRNNSSTTITLYATEYVEIRMVFGCGKG